MNTFQERWWLQAKSDFGVWLILRNAGCAACHQLHYLQMATEKLGKAYFWQKGTPPRKGHAFFVWFMRSQGAAPNRSRKQIAEVFEFSRFEDFQNWVQAALPLAYALQALAPDLSKDGPNPEFPWPSDSPVFVPAIYQFDVWRNLTTTGRGRQLMRVIRLGIDRFPLYA